MSTSDRAARPPHRRAGRRARPTRSTPGSATARSPRWTRRRAPALVAVAARAYAAAAEEGADAAVRDDLTPTDAVVLATAALRAHDLNPFDLALWFSRSSS